MKIRQAAFEGKNKMLRGNLHCHTTRSDGKGTPENVIRQFEYSGYDFLALTDHRYYNYENFAEGSNLLIIPGMEMDCRLPGPGIHCIHTVAIGPEKQDGNGYEQDQRLQSGVYECAADAQPMFDDIIANNNLAIFCHPNWSGNTSAEVQAVKGYSMIEVWNSGCAMTNHTDYAAPYWDELLLNDQHIWGVATDDGHPVKDHCHGWVRVNAEKNVASVLDALKRGAFYASTGPEIYDFFVEDGIATVMCSPCSEIRFRHFRVPYGVQSGYDITGASQQVREGTNYIRAEVVDDKGRVAWTNPIFLTW